VTDYAYYTPFGGFISVGLAARKTKQPRPDGRPGGGLPPVIARQKQGGKCMRLRGLRIPPPLFFKPFVLQKTARVGGGYG